MDWLNVSNLSVRLKDCMTIQIHNRRVMSRGAGNPLGSLQPRCDEELEMRWPAVFGVDAGVNVCVGIIGIGGGIVVPVFPVAVVEQQGFSSEAASAPVFQVLAPTPDSRLPSPGSRATTLKTTKNLTQHHINRHTHFAYEIALRHTLPPCMHA